MCVGPVGFLQIGKAGSHVSLRDEAGTIKKPRVALLGQVL